jgi:organic hydroperoxide reductase OsmC/OhrA
MSIQDFLQRMKRNPFFQIFLVSVSASYSEQLNALMEEYKIELKKEIDREIASYIEEVKNPHEITSLDAKTRTMCIGAIAVVRSKIKSL